MSVIFVRKVQALPGKEFEAVKWGLEIAKLSAEVMGVEVMFGQQVGGPIGHVAWRATHANMGALEAAMLTRSSQRTSPSMCRTCSCLGAVTTKFGPYLRNSSSWATVRKTMFGGAMLRAVLAPDLAHVRPGTVRKPIIYERCQTNRSRRVRRADIRVAPAGGRPLKAYLAVMTGTALVRMRRVTVPG